MNLRPPRLRWAHLTPRTRRIIPYGLVVVAVSIGFVQVDAAQDRICQDGNRRTDLVNGKFNQLVALFNSVPVDPTSPPDLAILKAYAAFRKPIPKSDCDQ